MVPYAVMFSTYLFHRSWSMIYFHKKRVSHKSQKQAPLANADKKSLSTLDPPAHVWPIFLKTFPINLPLYNHFIYSKSCNIPKFVHIKILSCSLNSSFYLNMNTI